MKIVYQADDGREFDNEFECRNYERWYERSRKILGALSKKKIVMLTFEVKRITEKDLLSCEKIESVLSTVYYFYCSDKEVLKILSENFAENFCENIAYYYDEESDRWTELNYSIMYYESALNNLYDAKKIIENGITM